MKKALLLFAGMIASLGTFAQGSFNYDTRGTGTGGTTVFKEVYDPNGYVLQACQDYEITIRGNYSIWDDHQWPNPCPAADPSPLYPSPGVSNGSVGFDPEFTYATKIPGGCSMSPIQDNRIELDLNGFGNTPNWQHARDLDVNGVNHTFDGATHSYTYIITGNGFPLGIRQYSGQNNDDYGILEVEINPVAPTPCNEIELAMDLGLGLMGPCNLTTYAYIVDCNPNIQVLSSSIDFGDGVVVSGHNAGHVYTVSGTYLVTATFWITNGEECCKIETAQWVDVKACDPCELIQQVDFMADYSQSPTVVFTEIGIQSLSTYGFKYVWNFGDGTIAVGGSTIAHTYAAPGVYNVSLSVYYVDEVNEFCCHQTILHEVMVDGEGKIGNTQGSSAHGSTDGLDEVSGGLNVFPNPSTGVMEVSLTDDAFREIQIFDASGGLIQTVSNRNGASSARLDLSEHGNGIYLIRTVSTSGKVYSNRIILQ